MLNRTGVKVETYGADKQILFAIEHQVSVGIVVSDDVGVETADGRKIAKAGTILSGDLFDRTEPFIKAEKPTVQTLSNETPPTTPTTKEAPATGVLLHDVDVTAGDENGTLLIFGFVNIDRIDSETRKDITEDVIAELPMIKFISGN